MIIKKRVCYLMAAWFFAGSIIFPLGDFSLLRDIPQMYRNYLRITCAEDADVLDFVGDYLLHGKDLLGHNEHDKVPLKGSEVQFLHQASSPNILIGQPFHFSFHFATVLASPPVFDPVNYAFQHFSKTFRPPLG